MGYTEKLAEYVKGVTESKGQQKEMEGLFEELPGEIFDDVEYEVRKVIEREVNERLNASSVEEWEEFIEIEADLIKLVYRAVVTRLWGAEW